MFDKSKEIPISADHGGYEMKQYLIEKLSERGYKLIDMGTFSKESVDYPDFIHPLAKAVNDQEYELGIILCGSGNGAQMTANKYSNVRAGLAWDKKQAELTKQHNKANILSLPGRFLDFNDAVEIVEVFLNTEFEGGRHNRRVEKISQKS
ncbi:MAG: ribose 5-phosphate isomerase B [Bacteroidales bacterium]|nr:ribose 5-phosphate isomerase B [Bacteroidales bacterium]MCF8343056.1 ribose 5-phosphate isomerase B [Bacteroidales bacterium]MCF8349799.1 ribose 5-phosphate isomerase B [Bacteroidales bacterium]MCF8375919.1 ribose 5-phosphate isomerase B [Bacteroidales bacterium]